MSLCQSSLIVDHSHTGKQSELRGVRAKTLAAARTAGALWHSAWGGKWWEKTAEDTWRETHQKRSLFCLHVGHQQLDQVTLCLLNTILDNRLGLTDAATGTVTETVAILGLQKDQVAARKWNYSTTTTSIIKLKKQLQEVRPQTSCVACMMFLTKSAIALHSSAPVILITEAGWQWRGCLPNRNGCTKPAPSSLQWNAHKQLMTIY